MSITQWVNFFYMHIKIFGSFFFFCFPQKESVGSVLPEIKLVWQKNDSEKFQIMRFSHSFCLPLTEFFLSIRIEISVRSLPLCQILQIFTINFQRYFRSKYKFYKIFDGTRSLNLHLREPGVLARAISGPGRMCQETISRHLNIQNYDSDLEIYCLNCKI